MFAPITLLTKVYYPHLSFATNTLSALLLVAFASSAQAATSDSAVSGRFEEVAALCASQTQALPAESLKSLSANRLVIDCKRLQLKRYQAEQALHSRTVEQAARQQYLIYKARAWLDYASYQDTVDSRFVAGTQALQAADTILQALLTSTEQNLALNPDIPTSSALMRPDLWAILTALKDSGGINYAPKELAFSEVGLIWAAADHCAHGSSQSGSRFTMADRWLEQARESYINVHDSKVNVALEQLINRYYKQYASLDPSDDSCHGQSFLAPIPDADTL